MGGGVGLILKAEAYSSVFLLLIVLTVEILSFSNGAAALSHVKTPSNSSSKYSIKRRHFPPDFLFGVTTSSYQYEGGTWEDGRRPSIWDAFTHSHPNNIKDKSNGDIAADSYHLYKDDIALVKQLGMNAYRFSVSWSRVLPNRKVNEKGIKYYNNVINEAISQGLTPFLTLFHLDLPQALQDEYGGFLSNRIVNDFRDFADLCFREFGDRVKHWITLNEPGTFLSGGYVVGDLAPGRCTPPRCEEGKSDVEPYIVCHNMLLAHATAVELYRRKYQKSQSGVIGVAVNADWLIPYNASNALDHKAAQRAYDFNLGWFLDPMVRGDYPSSMKYYVGDRLPKFSKEESKLLSGTFDFLGINYYSSRYVMDLSYIGSHYGDAHVNTTYERDGKLIGPLTAAPWIHVYPRGLCNVLLYIKHKYQNPLIYVTENGVAEAANGTKPPAGVGRDSNVAVSYFQTHLSSLRRAIKKGANVKGYFVWSLLDNFEWNSGYTLRFGLYQVEVQNPSIRIPRKTAIWFQKFLKAD